MDCEKFDIHRQDAEAPRKRKGKAFDIDDRQYPMKPPEPLLLTSTDFPLRPLRTLASLRWVHRFEKFNIHRQGAEARRKRKGNPFDSVSRRPSMKLEKPTDPRAETSMDFPLRPLCALASLRWVLLYTRAEE
jgi:hypothetical protein